MFSFNYYFINILLAVFYLSVDTFALLTGFFSYKKVNVKHSRIIELVFIVLFYSIIITIIFYLLNLFNFRNQGIAKIIKSVFPFLVGRYWYITCYFALFFLIPFLNIFINNISKEKFKKFLIISFMIFSIIPNLILKIDLFKMENGYSPFWMIFMYFLGAYISKYKEDFDKDIKHYIKFFSIMLICSSTLNYLVKISSTKILGHMVRDSWFIDYTSPFTVIEVSLITIIFIKLNKKYNNTTLKIIETLSLSSFAVYIVHCHYLLFDYVIKDAMLKFLNNNFFMLMLITLGIIIIVYILITFIDQIRKSIFKIFKINNLIDFIGKKVDIRLNI